MPAHRPSHRAAHPRAELTRTTGSTTPRLKSIGLVGLLALALLAGAFAVGRPNARTVADPTTTDATLAFLRGQRDACQAMLDSARTSEQTTRARTCIADVERAIADLLATPTPGPTATAKPTGSAPAPTPSQPPAPPSSPPSGAWPGPANTGVPSGVVLKPYAGPCQITAPNTVIDSALISCDLTVAGAGVKIRRSQVNGSVSVSTPDGVTALRLTITDSTINAGHRQVTGLSDGLCLAQRVEVLGGNRGVLCAWRCTLQYSWFHDTYVTSDWHASAVRAERYSTIIHNTLACDWLIPTAQDGGCSADLTGYPDFAAPHDWLIQNNLFVANPVGAAFCAYGGSSAGKPFSTDPLTGTNIQFLDNTFQRGTVPGDKGLFRCAYYGAIDSFNAAKAGAAWSNNRYDDGVLITP